MIPKTEDRNLEESSFVVSFTSSMFETYMSALASLQLSEKFDLKVTDTWEGHEVPKVISLYKKEITLEEDIKRLKAEVVRMVKDCSAVDESKYPKYDFWPLMTIQSQDVPKYEETIMVIKSEKEAVRKSPKNILYPYIVSTPLRVSDAYDKESKHFLYPNGGLFYQLRPTDLIRFLVRVERKMDGTAYKISKCSYDSSMCTLA